MTAILTAILDDGHVLVKELLRADRHLAVQRIEKPTLLRSKICHWLYVGDTPLHLAAAGYRETIVRALLSAGADPNAAGNHRRSTPLHYAADGNIVGPAWNPKRQVKTLRILLNAGADIHAGATNGATALHRAVRTRCADAVRFLLDAGADPTRKNNPGSTAFHLAVQNTGRGGSGDEAAISAQRSIIKEFVSRGVSTKLKDGKGKSVLDWARSDWIRDLLSSNAKNSC
jgi:ankyrin repeat protein